MLPTRNNRRASKAAKNKYREDLFWKSLNDDEGDDELKDSSQPSFQDSCPGMKCKGLVPMDTVLPKKKCISFGGWDTSCSA